MDLERGGGACVSQVYPGFHLQSHQFSVFFYPPTAFRQNEQVFFVSNNIDQLLCSEVPALGILEAKMISSAWRNGFD